MCYEYSQVINQNRQQYIINFEGQSSNIKRITAMSTFYYLFKFVVIGDTSVGKSCILLHFLQKKFKFNHDTTIGVEFGSKIIEVQDKKIKLQVWDTAGQQTFKSITRSYYKGSIGILLVYDITSRDSFISLAKWLEQVKNYANDKITTLLVGNKTDMDHKREVSLNQGQEMAKKNGLLFMQCSAKTGHNIDGLFVVLAENIVGRISKGEIDTSNQNIGIKLGKVQKNKQIVNKRKHKCC